MSSVSPERRAVLSALRVASSPEDSEGEWRHVDVEIAYDMIHHEMALSRFRTHLNGLICAEVLHMVDTRRGMVSMGRAQRKERIRR